MRRNKVILLVAVIVVALSVAATRLANERVPERDPIVSHPQVKFIMNLQSDGWYWVQVCLPSGGDLMAETSKDVYEKHRKARLICRSGHVGRKWFRTIWPEGGETIKGKYVVLPTEDKMFPKITALVLFAKNGSIWRIPVPDQIRHKQAGRLFAGATMYR